MLWLVFLVLTLLVLGILLYPLVKDAGKNQPQRIDFDMVVYRSQLDELEQEIESGLLTKEQADAARAEVHRRMLAAEDAERDDTAGRSGADGKRARLVVIGAISAIVPLGAAVMYGALGSPQLPGEPYAWRQQHDPGLVAATSADALAKQLQSHPAVAGFKRLAEMYFTARNYDQAAAAYRHAVDMGANDVVTWSALGEAIAMANGGAVVPEALAAFTSALASDPHDRRSRFYIGLAEAQIGNLKEAVAVWRDLEKDSEPGAPWLPMVREHIAAFARQGGFDPASVPPSPPSVGALRTAIGAMTGAMHGQGGMAPPAPPPSPSSAMPARTGDAQDTMIRDMVARLAARMKQNSDDATGWRRLAHAYNVLGEPDEAEQAIDHAVRLKPNDIDVQLTLAETEKALAAPGDETPPDFIATLRRVLKLDPTNLEALYYVGLAELKAGHTAAGRALWNRALAGPNNPDDPLMIALRGRLRALHQQ